MRIYHFYHLARHLEIQEALKLLVAAFQAFHRHFGIQAKNGLLSFGDLSQKIEKRQKLVQELLQESLFPETRSMDSGPPSLANRHGRIRFQTDPRQMALEVVYEDMLHRGFSPSSGNRT